MSTSSSDELAIRNLLARYAHLRDSDDLEAWAELFVEDAVLEYKGQVHVGRPAIAATAERSKQGRHILANSEVTFLDDDTASVFSDIIMITSEDGCPGISDAARYRDIIVRTSNGWRFKHKSAGDSLT